MLAISILALLSIAVTPAKSQSQEKLYAVMILNFAQNIQWPAGSIGDKFTIGILAYSPLATEIKSSTTQKKIAGRTIEVKEIYTPQDAQGCEIIFIPSFKSKKLPAFLTVLNHDATLIITNMFNLARQGSGINFLLKNGSLAYELNRKSVEARGMKVSSRIVSMGTLVE